MSVRSHDQALRARDLLRQIAVISSLGFTLVAVFVGVGGLGGTAVENSQGGALDSDATYLAPAGPAFSIWSVIYAGLVAYVVWQALPSQRASERQRALGWWVALTIVLNGLWLVAAQLLPIWATVIVIFLLLAALCVTFQRAVATRVPGDGAADAVLLDGVTGLHLGWVTVASAANVAAWLTEVGPTSWEDHAHAWGVAVLVVLGILGLGIAWASGWRVTPGLAIGWGAVWLAAGRLLEQPRSEPIGIAAIIVAVVVVVIPVAVAGLRLLKPQGD
ncbi:tryptophan-rich sensory protein [Microbacterium limosum]|uniref:Tryptophan-rich sensory protein n=1 Tax=Microbacterium limosum TaxID=3079935 RepID=A0AAU0MGS4_9MICO|nr:tryptophan-rich sensory protein [Microbacterium sp. Y20]WOQ69355.1 tryptophan-rich sensory protein [Microbacterium sp. Y20]